MMRETERTEGERKEKDEEQSKGRKGKEGGNKKPWLSWAVVAHYFNPNT